MKKRYASYLHSPLGILKIESTNTGITGVEFVMDEEDIKDPVPEVLQQCKNELDEYFKGKRKDFTCKLRPEGTAFEKKVWKELPKIKYGETVSYSDIAHKLKNPGAVRAVGLANGKNPIAIIIPCHRVIGKDGQLTGYGGGMWRKQWLLDHEGNISGKNPTLF